MKRTKFIVTTLVIIILFLSLAQTVISNMLSTAGSRLSEIDRELAFYKTQNDQIRETLLSASSLTTIASEAAILGFVDKKSQLVLTSSLPIAHQ